MKAPLLRYLAIVVCGLACTIFESPAWAEAGELDATFGNEGKVTADIAGKRDEGRAVVVQPDGKIVVAGWCVNSTAEFALLRYHADGALDESFGTNGKAIVGNGIAAYATSVALQVDGKIVVGGHAQGWEGMEFALTRFSADGARDSSFGAGGMITDIPSGSSDAHSYGLVVQKNGVILLAGYLFRESSGNDFSVGRFASNGLPLSGMTVSISSTSNDVGRSVVEQNDGKIVVAGYSSDGSSDNDFALVRFNADRTLDSTFGSEGKVLTPIGAGDDRAYSMALQPNGRIVVAGSSFNGTDTDFALVRYNADGSLDTGFGNGGKVTTPVGNSDDVANSVILLTDGRIIVAGSSISSSSGNDFALVRYNPDGSLDTSFGNGGKLTTSISSGTDVGFGVALQDDKKLLVVGHSGEGAASDIALLRYESIAIKPAGTTGPVIWTTTTSAHLSGSVNPNGAEASVIFETAKTGEPYELSGNASTHQSPLSGSDTQNVSGTKTGLLPHTTYKFRVSATSSAGTSVGEDVTFTTANSQPVANDKTIHPNGTGRAQIIFSPVTDASDADGDPLTVAVLSYSGTGTVQAFAGGVRHTGGILDGTETVTVEVSDGFGGSDQATITLSNAAPVATADSASASYGRVVAIPVLANDTDADGDTLGVVSFTEPSHGRVIRGGADPNMLVYIPQLGFSGVDSFTYTMSDGRSAAVTGTVEITVGARSNPSSSVAFNTETPVPGAGEQASGIPSGATWRIFGVPAINDAGQVAVLGTWKSPEGSGSGIFVDEQLVAKTGDPVPGLTSVTFKSFTDPVLNGAGRVAFLATITGSGVRKNNDTVLVTDAFSGELALVAREGDGAAETGEARFGKFYSVSLQGDDSDNAGLLFTASLLKGSGSPKVKPTNDLGAWLRTSSPEATPRKVVREGDPGFVGSEKIKSFQLLQALRGSPGQGRAHYKGDEISFTVTLTSKRQAVVRFRAGVLEEEALTGELLGEALPEAKWKSFGLPAADGTGMVSTVRASLQNGLGGVTKANATGIFVSIGRGGTYAPVVRLGDEAFGVPDAVFSALSDPLVSGWNPGVAFLGSIKGQGVRGNNNTGIWWQTLSGSSLVARAGIQASEAPEGALWKSFGSLALPDGERGPLFVGTLAKGAGAVNASNDTGLWAVDSVGELRLLVREQGAVGEKTLKSFSTLQAVSGSAGVRRSFNNTGGLVYRAYFTDGSQGVIKVQVP